MTDQQRGTPARLGRLGRPTRSATPRRAARATTWKAAIESTAAGKGGLAARRPGRARQRHDKPAVAARRRVAGRSISEEGHACIHLLPTRATRRGAAALWPPWPTWPRPQSAA